MRTQPRITDIACRVLALSALIGILFVIGCAGGGTQGSNPPPVTYTIGGTVSGLSGTGLVLQDNGGNNLSVSANATSFTFTTAIASGSAYSVTVFSQPSNPAQTCVVASGSGTASANVTGVQVTCTTNTYTIGGTVSGLSGAGLVLQNNGGNNLSVSANGSFTFTTAIASGSTFNVTVFSQPSNPAQTCGVTRGSGTVASANVTNVWSPAPQIPTPSAARSRASPARGLCCRTMAATICRSAQTEASRSPRPSPAAALLTSRYFRSLPIRHRPAG